jgi:hypothetical protein
MKQRRRRKCRCCGELYRPDYRNVYHQEYCSRAACRAESKVVSQRRWLAKPENHDTYCGSMHVDRVRSWRKAHPGYWRRGKGALQEICSAQATGHQQDKPDLVAVVGAKGQALQDLCLAQDPLFVGFMAHLTGALQEDIAFQITRFQTHGQMILGRGPGIGS